MSSPSGSHLARRAQGLRPLQVGCYPRPRLYTSAPQTAQSPEPRPGSLQLLGLQGQLTCLGPIHLSHYGSQFVGVLACLKHQIIVQGHGICLVCLKAKRPAKLQERARPHPGDSIPGCHKSPWLEGSSKTLLHWLFCVSPPACIAHSFQSFISEVIYSRCFLPTSALYLVLLSSFFIE